MNSMFLLASLVLASGPVQYSDLVDEKGSLGGLSGFTVSVYVNEPAEQAGVTKETLHTTVELGLRRNGVPVFEGGDAKTPASPGFVGTVVVEVVALESTIGLAHVGVARYEVSAQQVVRLLSDEAAYATTWSRGGVVSGPFDRMAAQLRDRVNNKLDSFCNEYLSARSAWLQKRSVRHVKKKS